jgi:hypothetical protein
MIREKYPQILRQLRPQGGGGKLVAYLQMFKGHRGVLVLHAVRREPKDGRRCKLDRVDRGDAHSAEKEDGGDIQEKSDSVDTAKERHVVEEKHAEETNKINSNYNTLWKT